jgi:hypothetical protein
METLNSAARAAGFAMAVSDETQTAVEAKAEAQPGAPGRQAPVIVRSTTARQNHPPLWVKNLLQPASASRAGLRPRLKPFCIVDPACSRCRP